MALQFVLSFLLLPILLVNCETTTTSSPSSTPTTKSSTTPWRPVIDSKRKSSNKDYYQRQSSSPQRTQTRAPSTSSLYGLGGRPGTTTALLAIPITAQINPYLGSGSNPGFTLMTPHFQESHHHHHQVQPEFRFNHYAAQSLPFNGFDYESLVSSPSMHYPSYNFPPQDFNSFSHSPSHSHLNHMGNLLPLSSMASPTTVVAPPQVMTPNMMSMMGSAGLMQGMDANGDEAKGQNLLEKLQLLAKGLAGSSKIKIISVKEAPAILHLLG